ncbi:MAG: SET domain-containing protein-lysine N-methyltransferase [Patescibacteria group bacterium]|nr:SET domain-containing protein-lysine N-methyltransferase [Patescibacteria group bacterium]
MFLVKTKLGPSKINGIGVFADQDIPQGTIVQKFIEGIDSEITSEIVKALPKLLKNNLLHYAYKHQINGQYILNADDARFLNSSENPNLIGDGLNKEADKAGRDIWKGEELTVNYNDFDALAHEKLK